MLVAARGAGGGDSGGDTTGGAKLLSTTSFASFGFPITDSGFTLMLFDTVIQSTPIYSTSSGVFTVPETAVYMLYITYLATPDDTVTGPFAFSALKLFVNGVDVDNLIAIDYNEVQALWVAVGSIAIKLQANDELSLHVYQPSTGQDSSLISNLQFNNVHLYKL
jgi:hypothetical protein